MENKIRFSVIIPTYNCATYLKRCVDSILSQLNNEDEIIIVNDGSTDNTTDVCKKLSDIKIKIINKTNTGVSDSRNQALKIARGKFIIFLDADDYVDNGYIKKVVEIIKKYSDIQFINFGFFSDVEDITKGVVSSDKINYKDYFYKTKREIYEDIVNLNDSCMMYNIWNKIYLASVIKKNDIYFENVYFSEDIIFNRKYVEKINNLYNCSDCFYHYVREREGAVTKKYKEDIFAIRKKEFIDYNDYFEGLNIKKSDYYEFSCRRYLERILGCIENVYCSNFNFRKKYFLIKEIISDKITVECLKYAKPKTFKIKVLLIPIKMNNTIITMTMGKMFHIFKTKFPALFNKLKNNR